MQKIYGYMSAGDGPGLARLVEESKDPFRKTVGLASIAHIYIQAYKPAEADAIVKRMPENDADCQLAKAEALSAVGSAWLRALDDVRARRAFESAERMVRSANDIPMGKVSVMLAVAEAQFRGGLKTEGSAAFASAIELANALPVRPPNSSAPSRIGVRYYRYQAQQKILDSAVTVKDAAPARLVSDQWLREEGDAGPSTARAWFNGEYAGEAIEYAKKSTTPARKVDNLLGLADTMLTASAPVL